MPSEYEKASSLLTRGLGIMYIIAMFPFLFQYKGIMGEQGVQPAQWLVQEAWAQEGLYALIRFPSLYWIWPSDTMLLALILICLVGAVGMILDFKTWISAFLAWLAFLSFTTIGGDFTIIIIDLFLAEVGFLGCLLALSRKQLGYVPRIISWLFLILLFRMWFSMGMIKFYFPGDSWKDFTFFGYFFQYQPMPNPISWELSHWPQWTHSLAIVFTFIIEMIFPFFIFLGRKWRMLAFIGFTGISIMIWLTGNYGYFNPLTILIGVFLIKDNEWPFKGWKTNSIPDETKSNKWLLPISGYLILQHFIYILILFDPTPNNPQNHLNYFSLFPNTKNNMALEPFRWSSYTRVVNPYGVFKDISRFKIELRFEGSTNGQDWKAYEFRYMPSSRTQSLKFFAPYYPRLDHLFYYEQYGMGIYAQNPINSLDAPQNPLNPYYTVENPWICKFIQGLEENNPYITNLLAHQPFEENPPQFIRIRAFILNFTTRDERIETHGDYWKGEYLFTPYDSSSPNPQNCQPIYSLKEIVSKIRLHYENRAENQ